MFLLCYCGSRWEKRWFGHGVQIRKITGGWDEKVRVCVWVRDGVGMGVIVDQKRSLS